MLFSINFALFLNLIEIHVYSAEGISVNIKSRVSLLN